MAIETFHPKDHDIKRLMARGTVSNQLISSHLKTGTPEPGEEISLAIDQTLMQDATGTLVMLELEAIGVERIQTELSAQYVDHNLIQADFKNPDDHLFLQSACQKFGIHFSRPGNGVSHPVHMAKFGIPGKTLLGSDSHTCAAGSLGMLAIGVGGLNVVTALMGHPFDLRMPLIWGIRLLGELPAWVSAKDIILEMLRRHGVAGGRGKILEYYGPGVDGLSAMDRHVIANMGAELGATTSIFPSDRQTLEFLREQKREDQWQELLPAEDAQYDIEEEIDLDDLEPLIAKPQSPGHVIKVREAAGEKIYQSYIGSSANPGFRDFAVAADMVAGRKVPSHISFDINPSSREILENLLQSGHIQKLIQAGARLHQAGCNGCIGMGQAPATHENSLRTVPRNFPGRSGTKDDRVWLCSPETATASALMGEITDPRDLGIAYPKIMTPKPWLLDNRMIDAPVAVHKARRVKIRRGPNITMMPQLTPIPDELSLTVGLKAGNNISTDEILPAGSRALPFRSNIAKISEFAFSNLDPIYVERSKQMPEGHIIVAGENYGQGSSREHAALALAYLGLKAVIAKNYARIHLQNLINFGILAVEFVHAPDYKTLATGDMLIAKNVRRSIENKKPIVFRRKADGQLIAAQAAYTDRQIELLLAGGLINWLQMHSDQSPQVQAEIR